MGLLEWLLLARDYTAERKTDSGDVLYAADARCIHDVVPTTKKYRRLETPEPAKQPEVDRALFLSLSTNMGIESSGDQDSGERKIGPTVTKDRWLNHARTKLSKGYVLIVSPSRKNANFYSPVKGYEMCAFDVAKTLIADGSVMKTREHHLGDVYELSGNLPQTPPPALRKIEDDDEPEFVDDLAGVDVDEDDDQLDDEEETDVDSDSADVFEEDDDEEEDEEDLDEDDRF